MSNDNQPSSILFADSQLMSAQLAELVSAVPASYYTRSELEQLAAALRELLGAVGRVRVRGEEVTGADDAPPASTDPRHVGRVLAGLKR